MPELAQHHPGQTDNAGAVVGNKVHRPWLSTPKPDQKRGARDQVHGSLFSTLAAVLAAAVFIPLVMDMGGNVGTQSTTIFARGFALGHIKLNKFWRYLMREGLIGLTMGLLLGAVAGVIAYFWQGLPNGIPQIGIAVGLALTTVITLAAMLGFLLPYAMVKLGLDHAPGADPFITTIKDFTGLFLYFYLVTLLIGTPEPSEEPVALTPTPPALIQTVSINPTP